MIETLFALSIIGWAAFSVGVVALFGAIYTFKTRHSISFVWTLVCLAAIGFAFQTHLFDFGANFMTTKPGETAAVVNWLAIGLFAVKALGVWLVGAAVTSVFYWFSFVRDVKERFTVNLEKITNRMKNELVFDGWSDRAKSSVSKAAAIGTRNDNVFLMDDFHLNLHESITGRHHRIDSVLDVEWEPKPKKAEASRMGEIVKAVISSEDKPEDIAAAEQEALAIADDRLTKLEEAVAEVLPPRANNFKADIAYAATVWPITLVSLLIADLLRQLVDLAFTYFRGFLDSVSKMAFGEFSAK